MKHISYRDVSINGGFWKSRQDINLKTTIHTVEKRFRDTGRFDAFEFNWKEGMPNKPHIYWDSDVAKWMESAAYILQKTPDKELESSVEHLIDCIEKHRDASGYFNIYFTVCEPESRFTRRSDHELYCAGHLIEAAVAYYEATKKDRFLKLMCDYADYIEKVFVHEACAAFTTPGHQEIELALVRLYRCTGEKRYLELSKFFIDQRGQSYKDTLEKAEHRTPFSNQSHLPVRSQETAEGHCVRACYMYGAMADLAAEYGDKELLFVCKKLFSDITTKKMYITGGLGQSHIGEAFTIDYDLPNASAYAETCAAISLVFFAHRMLPLEVNSVYSDVVERALYNGVLSGISLTGDSFFYENPLEIVPRLRGKDTSAAEQFRTRYPIPQRAEVFNCSCCPPNITRLIASVGGYIYSESGGTFFVHQYAACEMNHNGVKIELETNYPANGRVIIRTEGAKNIALRIPGWCDLFTVNSEYTLKNGYAYINNPPRVIELNFEMKAVLIQSSPRVTENSGKTALQMGPVVYCLEEIDNGPLLQNITLAKELNAEVVFDDFFGANVVLADGFRPDNSDGLYSPFSGTHKKTRLKFIPYYAFANRGECEMLVWAGAPPRSLYSNPF